MRKLGLAPLAYVVAAALSVALVACGESEPTDPTAKQIKARQYYFKALGAAMKTIEDQSKSRKPDTKAIAEAAEKIAAVAKDIPTWFPPGSGPEAGFKTDAKPEIWADRPKFEAVHKEFMGESAHLTDAIASGNIANITEQYFATSVACANCHKPFRVEHN